MSVAGRPVFSVAGLVLVSEQAPDLYQIDIRSAHIKKACQIVMSVGAIRIFISMDVPEVLGLS